MPSPLTDASGLPSASADRLTALAHYGHMEIEGSKHLSLAVPIGDYQPSRESMKRLRPLFARLDEELLAVVDDVIRLTPTIIEVIVRAPAAARNFEPGQFYRLQNFECSSPVIEGTSSRALVLMKNDCSWKYAFCESLSNL